MHARRVAAAALLLCSSLLCACRLLPFGRRSATPSELAGSAWLATEMDGKKVLDQAQLTLRFDDAKNVSGFAGCNFFRGAAAFERGSPRFGPLISSRRACKTPELTGQEERYLSALRQVSALRRSDGVLLLLDTDGNKRVRFAPLPGSGALPPPDGTSPGN